MAIGSALKYASAKELFLDPINPRLGRNLASPNLGQEKILDRMRQWSLEELAVSFLESGFWPHESLLVVQEKIYGKNGLVVVEGNRRLAALKMLQRAMDGESVPSKWLELINEYQVPASLLSKIPYVIVDKRSDVSAFLGFRHVTGIKEWRPAEKAQYIAKLIDEEGLGYEDVRKKIGSKTPAVRRHYISYRILLQMDEREAVDIGKVEEKFSVLFLSLRTSGAQKYLHIDLEAEPAKAKRPVPKAQLKKLENFAVWLFGTDTKLPLFTDSRNVDRFGLILESDEAVKYLENSDNPSFDLAYRVAGGDEPELVISIKRASDYAKLAISNAHQFRNSSKVKSALEIFGRDALQLLSVFPAIREKVLAEAKDA